MIIDDALNMAYSYAATICQDSELCKVSQEFNGLAGETERTYITKSTTITSYSDIQNLLSKLNEKESVRKSNNIHGDIIYKRELIILMMLKRVSILCLSASQISSSMTMIRL